MPKALREDDVIVGAGYKLIGTEVYFVVKSLHRDQAYVKFDDGHYGYVAYADMESAS